MASGDGPDAIDLPGARATRTNGALTVEASPGRGDTVDRVAVEVPLDVSRAGRVRWFGGTLSWVPGEPPARRTGPLEASLHVPTAEVVTLRGIRPGDRVRTRGGQRALKEIARAARISVAERWRAPVVCVSGSPCWLAGANVPFHTVASDAVPVWMVWSPPRQPGK